MREKPPHRNFSSRWNLGAQGFMDSRLSGQQAIRELLQMYRIPRLRSLRVDSPQPLSSSPPKFMTGPAVVLGRVVNNGLEWAGVPKLQFAHGWTLHGEPVTVVRVFYRVVCELVGNCGGCEWCCSRSAVMFCVPTTFTCLCRFQLQLPYTMVHHLRTGFDLNLRASLSPASPPRSSNRTFPCPHSCLIALLFRIE